MSENDKRYDADEIKKVYDRAYHRVYDKAYNANPERQVYLKAYKRAYNALPEQRAYRRAYMKAYRALKKSEQSHKKPQDAPTKPEGS